MNRTPGIMPWRTRCRSMSTGCRPIGSLAEMQNGAKIITRLHIFIFSFMLLCVFPSSAALTTPAKHLKSYRDTIIINGTGAAEIKTEVKMGEYHEPVLNLPFNYPKAEGLSVKDEKGHVLPSSLETREGICYLCVNVEGKPGNLVITFRDPAYLVWKKAGPREFGRYRYMSEFQNTTCLILDEYAMEVVLPEGFIVDKFVNTIPPFTDEDPEPPFSSWKKDGLTHVFIKASNLSLGRQCMIEYTFVKSKFPYALLVVCVIIMAALLVFFTDVVRGKQKGSP